jgi:hypothetical protein
MAMNSRTKFWLTGAAGAWLCAASMAAFGATLDGDNTVSAGRRAPVATVSVTRLERLEGPASPLLADGVLGQAIVEFLGAGIGFGLLGFGLTRLASQRGESRRAEERKMPIAGAAIKPLVLLAIPRVFDATGSEFDDAKRPAFLPVTSLTEEQVQRRRASHKRQECRFAETSA